MGVLIDTVIIVQHIEFKVAIISIAFYSSATLHRDKNTQDNLKGIDLDKLKVFII